MGRGNVCSKEPRFFISAHRFSGNPIKLIDNATTNQKQARAFLHDRPHVRIKKRGEALGTKLLVTSEQI